MSPIEQHYYAQDHAEAIAIARQLAIAPAGCGAEHVIALNRFCDCDDGEGYDVPAARMRELKAYGLVVGGRGGWYSLTDLGQSVRDAWFDVVDVPAGSHSGAVRTQGGLQ